MVSSEHLNGFQSRLQTHNGFDKVWNIEINYREKNSYFTNFLFSWTQFKRRNQ